jgi:hypothetical protein
MRNGQRRGEEPENKTSVEYREQQKMLQQSYSISTKREFLEMRFCEKFGESLPRE